MTAHAPPALRTVFLRQLRLLGTGRGVTMAALGLTVLGVTAVVLRLAAGAVSLAGVTAGPVSLAIVFVAAFWAALVTWWDEGPSHRAYHWLLPVSRPIHDLLRSLAGWCWLAVTVTGGVAVGSLVGRLWTGPVAPGAPAAYLAVAGTATFWYLVGAIAAELSDRPVWWLVGGWLLTHAADAGLFVLAPERWERIRAVVVEGTLGLGPALEAPQMVLRTGSPNPWPALALWTGLAALLLVAAASLHRETAI